jgi:hypothetical protein
MLFGHIDRHSLKQFLVFILTVGYTPMCFWRCLELSLGKEPDSVE